MQTIVQTPTNDLAQSVSFYKNLNFKLLTDNIFTDGKVIIEINDDKFTRLGIKFYNEDWTPYISRLEKLVHLIKTDDNYLFALSSGTWVYLIKGKNIINYKQEENSFSTLGNFAGVSLETTAIKKSIAILNVLNFKKTMGNIEQGWLVLTNNQGFGISLMVPFTCPHLFFNPSLTYFNGKNNLLIIEKIRNLKIPITQEITHFNKENIVDNIIIRDNGGLGFFIFSD